MEERLAGIWRETVTVMPNEWTGQPSADGNNTFQRSVLGRVRSFSSSAKTDTLQHAGMPSQPNRRQRGPR